MLSYNELLFIQIQLTRINKQEDELMEARKLIQREIALKELEKNPTGSENEMEQR